ncbi:hypothetical protein DL95DRAFT_410592 [Leptodontidium sp. 2 PMI_412]|nr:hypothetical protein DL95DRAFT_410592 [Leptodontidium sp. 2 PMI_412]
MAPDNVAKMAKAWHEKFRRSRTTNQAISNSGLTKTPDKNPAVNAPRAPAKSEIPATNAKIASEDSPRISDATGKEAEIVAAEENEEMAWRHYKRTVNLPTPGNAQKDVGDDKGGNGSKVADKVDLKKNVLSLEDQGRASKRLAGSMQPHCCALDRGKAELPP